MSTTVQPVALAALGSMPSRMKVLYVTTPERTGGWLTEAFAADSAAQIVLAEVVGESAGLARLRDEVYDAVLVSHEPGNLDGLDFIEGLRAGGNEEPMILLGSAPPEEIDALCYEVGADDYCCVAETTVRGLLWKFARAIERHQLLRENRRLVQAERQRLQQEHHEAERLLDQQRALIADLESLGQNKTEAAEQQAGNIDDCLAISATDKADSSVRLPESLVTHYRELLRAYVIMGVGNLADEMANLTELLAVSGFTAQRALQLHVRVLEEMVQGLGNRSARHVINRADLLALEVIGHLADGYRQRYHERSHPPRQLPLPGFEAATYLPAA